MTVSTPRDLVRMSAEAQMLKSTGHIEDALAFHRRIVSAFPSSATAVFNYASTLCDAGYWADGFQQVSKAATMGLDKPECWLVRARCSQALGYLDDAEADYRRCIRQRPTIDAHHELVQLRWMRSADITYALADLNCAINAEPPNLELTIIKARALSEAGNGEAAYALLHSALSMWPRDGRLATLIAQTALTLSENEPALEQALAAVTLEPDSHAARAVLVESLLAADECRKASVAAEEFRVRAPFNQHAIALQTVAWRRLGDARWEEFCDYDSLLCVTQLDTPPGWTSLSQYMNDLTNVLHQAHHFRTHPFAQSVRHGSQAADILRVEHPATHALPIALDKPIRAYLEQLGNAADPLRDRHRDGYRFQGMWSIRMLAGGHHISHVHPNGWVSAVCYVDVPLGMSNSGMTQFGEPPATIAGGLKADRYVEPLPGRLVLFPSYMWHGALPFCKPGARLTFAFDLIPV